MPPAVLDPLSPTAHGHWRHRDVRVIRRRGSHTTHSAETVCTPRFCVRRQAGALIVEHDLTPDEICDELAVLLAEELVEQDILRGQFEFEAVFTGIVRSTVHGGMPAWLQFYRNSLAKLESGATAFAAVHAYAADLVLGRRLVDLGSCFGFFPLRMSRLGFAVTATDLSAPTMTLLAGASRSLGRPLITLQCDAAAVLLTVGCADSVTALHLIEHLEEHTGTAVIDEALRLARRRVVIAVPFEDEPRECYGHIRGFDLDTLHRMANDICDTHPGVHASAHAHHGGWLVIDRV